MFQANNIRVYPKVFKPIMLPANNIQVYHKAFKPIKYAPSKQYSSLSQSI